MRKGERCEVCWHFHAAETPHCTDESYWSILHFMDPTGVSHDGVLCPTPRTGECVHEALQNRYTSS